MSMKSKNSPRRPYVRAGQYLILWDGKYYGRDIKRSAFVKDGLISVALDESGISVLRPSGGKRRVQVTQGDVVETWREQNVVFTPHTAKTPPVDVAPETPSE